MINGNEYAWEDLQVVMEGKAQPLNGVVEIEYTTKKEHSNIYGKGDKPVAMGRGKREYSGKIVLLQSEFEAIQRSLPGGSDVTQKLPFSITVAYAPAGGEETTDQLTYCRINEVKKGMKTGDGNQLIELPLTIGNILYNI
jgi:hypothetical protein